MLSAFNISQVSLTQSFLSFTISDFNLLITSPGIENCSVYGFRFLKFSISIISPDLSILILIQSSFSRGSFNNATTLFCPSFTFLGSTVKASFWHALFVIGFVSEHSGRWHNARPNMSVAIPSTLPTNDWSWFFTTHRRHFLNDGRAAWFFL